MAWEIFKLIFFLSIIVIGIFQSYKRVTEVKQLTEDEKAFITNTLAPFYEKIKSEYSPKAVAFVELINCPIKEMEKNSISACAWITDSTIIVQDISNSQLRIDIPVSNCKYCDLSIYKKAPLSYCLFLHFFESINSKTRIGMLTTGYCDWRDQEYKDIVDAEQFVNYFKNSSIKKL